MSTTKEVKVRVKNEVVGKDQVDALAASMGSAIKSAALFGAGIVGLGKAFSETFKLARDWQDQVQGFEKQVDGMSRAIGGMVDKVALSRTAKILGGDFAATQGQLDAVTKAAIAYGRATHTEFVPALEAITKSVAGGQTKALRQMGLDIEATGNASQKSAAILAELEKRFGGTATGVENVNEELDALSAKLKDAIAEFGAGVINSDLFRGALDAVKVAVDNLATSLKFLSTVFMDQRKATLQSVKDQLKAFNALYTMADSISFLVPGYQEKFKGAFEGAKTMLALLNDLEKRGVDLSSVGPGAAAASPSKRRTTRIGAGRKKTAGDGKWLGFDLWGAIEDNDNRRRTFLGEFDRKEADERLTNNARLAGKRQEAEENRRFAPQIIALDKAKRAQREYQRAVLDSQETLRGFGGEMKGMATGALADFTGGIWAAADAAIQSGEGFGAAMMQMTKAALLGIAQQATVKSIFALAEAALNWWNPIAVSNYLAAAGLYGSVAVAAGGIGLGISSTTAGSRARGGASTADSHRGASGGSHTFGERRRNEEQKINVQVFLGDKFSPAAQMVWSSQLQASVGRAA